MDSTWKRLATVLGVLNAALVGMGFVSYSAGWSALRDDLLKTAAPNDSPNIFTYQGRLTKGDGSALPNGQSYMRFAFFAQGTSGIELCRWEIPDVWIKDGNFRAQMGVAGSGTCVNSLSFRNLFSTHSEIWIEVSVGADAYSAETLTPRIQVGSVPRAHHAEVSEVSKTSLDGVPVGAVMAFFGTDAPIGWLIANGTTINKSIRPEYSALVDHLRAMGLGAGLPTDSAKLPDLRGIFLRGKRFDRSDSLAGPEDLEVGISRADTFASHVHDVVLDPAGSHNHGGGNHTHNYRMYYANAGSLGPIYTSSPTGMNQTGNVTEQSGTIINTDGLHTHSVTVGTTGGVETAPKFVTVLHVIKF